MVALGCMNIVLLAKENCTGPVSIFEGPKGLSDIVGMDLKHDWSKDDLGIIRRCVLKRYNAEVHTQSSLEAVEEILRENSPDPESIESVKVTTFLTAYHIVGGGVYGDRKVVSSKEQADHSLPFVLAVMLLDRQVYPGQFTDERINREDVQELMKKITVDTVSPLHKPLPFAGILDPYTDAYPEKLKTRVVIRLKDGQEITRKKDDYHGFYTRPFGWDDCIAKFKKLTEGLLSDSSSDRIIGMVRNLENYKVNDLLALSQAKEVPSSVAG
jgi:2-methylcitrate dehydratase